MTSPPPRTSTSRSNRDDVLQLLDSLDTYTPAATRAASAAASSSPTVARSSSHSTLRHSATGLPSARTTAASPGTAASTTHTTTTTAGQGQGKSPAPSAAEAQSVLDFLDEITQRTPSASTPAAAGSGGLGRSTSRQSLNSAAAGAGAGAGATGAQRRSIDAARLPPSASGGGVHRTPGTRAASGTGPRSSLGGGAVVAAARASSESARQEPPQPRAGAPTHPSAGASAPSPATSAVQPTPPPAQEGDSAASSSSAAAASAGGGGGGWGWSSMWSSATTVVQQASHLAQQAKVAAEEQVKTATSHGAGGIAGGLMKALGENEQAKKWSEGVMSYAKGAHLDQLGKELKTTTLRSLTDLLNAVAPPIAEHEVIEVSLSHDMVGYDGVEALVYRGMAKIMDQIEGGTLVVNSAAAAAAAAKTTTGDEAEETDDNDVRDLNVIDGLSEGWKLAESRLEDLIQATYKVPNAEAADGEGGGGAVTVPVTTCPVYMRLQPCLAPLPALPSSCLPTSTPDPTSLKSLFFLVLLRDPMHKLVHSSLSQSMPASWLEIPFEENEWVEDEMVEIIRRSVEIIGQEYITHRMRAQTVAIEHARAEAQKTLEQHQATTAAAASGPAAPSAESTTAPEALFDAQTEAEASQAAQEARVGVV
ncbi:hypothetical protein JCM3774_006330 [Rhodotorula dairenensis]